MKKIVIIGTLDTKGEEVGYLKELIVRRGHQPYIIDVGCGGEPRVEADITADEVARAASTDIKKLRASRERQKVTETMVEGAAIKLETLCRADEVEGIISIGGNSASTMASSILREVPYRIPKLILSTGASWPGSYRFFGPTGVTVMHSLVDIGGLNRMLKDQLGRAAGAICGMVEAETLSHSPEEGKPMVAMSTWGSVENCARNINEALRERYELVRFHAVGMPEVTMEKLIEEDYFIGIIDLVPSSITNEKFGGSRVSWSKRLEVAGEKGIPQIVVPGGVNTVSRVRPIAEVPIPELKIRKHYFIDSLRVLVWLNTDELKNIASIYAEKLNKAVGPTKVLIPRQGLLSMEKEDSHLYDLQSILAFEDSLRKELKPEIEIREVDANIDDAVFAQAVVAAFNEVMRLRNID